MAPLDGSHDEGARPERARADDAPTRFEEASFFVRSNGLKLRRLAGDLARPAAPGRKPGQGEFPHAVAESRTPLRPKDADPRELPLVRGKIENLRVACRALDGRAFEAGETASFWKLIGWPVRARGYVLGRELRSGCVVPAVAGGLCQLSGALFEAAVRAGFEIVERHAHTRRLDDSYAPERDATVYWNYVDLRFRSAESFAIEARLTRDELVVRLRTKRPHAARSAAALRIASLGTIQSHTPGDCMTCGRLDCSKNAPAQKAARALDAQANRVVLLDAIVPEFEAFLATEPSAHVVLPLAPDGMLSFAPRSLTARYEWKIPRTATTLLPVAEAARKAISWRASRERWPAGRIALERGRVLAEHARRAIPHQAEHLTVPQELAPWLWREGALQGRSFDVLASRLPVHVLQDRLERAFADSGAAALRDFRAPEWFVEAERELLLAADRVITPHAEIASLADNAVKLDWKLPQRELQSPTGRALLFPASLAAREGAKEALEVAKAMKLALVVAGRDLEQFSGHADVRLLRGAEVPWSDIGAVVHPALFESWPRLSLEARARGIPVIASRGVGLTREEARLVPFGDVPALAREVATALDD